MVSVFLVYIKLYGLQNPIFLGMEGDPCYLAPEVLAGRFTKACDDFNLCVTLLELATDMDLPRVGNCGMT